MARRRKSGSDGASLDSLLDTMTNVVGILIIMLIVTQVGVGEAVERIKGFVEEISEEQYQAALAESEDLKALLEQQRTEWKELEPELPTQQARLDQQEELLEQLKKELEKLSSSQIDPEVLKKEVDERKPKVEELERRVREQQEMIASLKARLAETPAKGPDQDARIVNLPDPRPAPKGAKPVVFICSKGRIVPLNTTALQREAQEVIRPALRTLIRDGRIDCDKLAMLFENRFVGDRYVQLKIRIAGDAKPRLAVFPREDVGDRTDVLTRSNSLFNQWLRKLNPRQHYIDFRVFSDGFETYLAARNVAAGHGFSAGWVPYAENSEYWIGLGADLKTTCAGRGPPKPTPPDPNRPNRPAPPADVVD
ncbi:hypothetical protein [Maioricimonas sp. JC845]|uniref:hypothetical protein n=1 Tax=Maioricimonas sp. JC845 TaxID=3232138 RepID=UPI00345AC127